jgi:hypothetical protein
MRWRGTYAFFPGGLPAFQDDVRLPRHPPWAQDHRTEGHDPDTRLDRAGKITRSGMAAGDHKAVAGAAGPAPEPCRIAQVVAGHAKDTQIQHISDQPAHRELVMRSADSDSLHAGRHLERQVRPLVDPKSKPPGKRHVNRLALGLLDDGIGRDHRDAHGCPPLSIHRPAFGTKK